MFINNIGLFLDSNSIFLLKIFIYYVCFSYSFLLSQFFDNFFYINFSNISKNGNTKNIFNLSWLNFFLIISIFILFLIIRFELKNNIELLKITSMLFAMYSFGFIFFNYFFFWTSFDKFNPNIFIILIMPLLVNILFYKNYINIILSLEYLSICTIGYISSFFYKNLNGLLSYLWSSIISALTIFLIVYYYNFYKNYYIINVFMFVYFSSKLGLLPLGFWLYGFYSNLNTNNILFYLSCIYINNILFVVILILNINEQSYIINFKQLNNNNIKYIVILFNIIFINLFYFNSNIKKILFINTLITSCIVYSIFL
jgi:hypothetical protein